MNNRYLYRAKRKKDGKWVEGAYYIEPYTDKCFIIQWNSTGLGFNEFIEVDGASVCQCTGLKDKNGVLIWENDIVRIVYNGIEYIYKVIWDASELDFKATNGKENYESNFQYLTCCEEIEIIGNSFDNKELLEVEE